MATVSSTTFDVILLNLLVQLQTVTGFPAERCGVSQDGDPEQVQRQADQFILVRLDDQTPDPHSVTGRGRNQPLFTRRVFVVLWTRLLLDEAQRDLVHLTDAALGHLPAEAKLWDALLCYEPTDGGNNWLVSEPIKPGPCKAPIKGKRADAVFAGWMWSGLQFDVSYALSMPTPSSQNLG
jgi:hypothetical protein